MLVVGGSHDLTVGGPALGLDDHGNHRRTLYALVNRRDVSPTLMIHDFPDPTQHSPKRTSTVTALQGLFALNGQLLEQQSQRLADRLRKEVSDDRRRILRAYSLLFSRRPSDRELELGLAYLGHANDEDKPDRWQQYAHVLLAANEFIFID
jgi:hypothetical protein